MVRIEVGQDGFRPPALEVPRARRLTIELLRTTNETCATKVVFPDEHIERELPLGAPVRVDIAADRARVVNFTCGMGMYRGSVIVR
jgi:plastocyanin domain-containing protein